MISSSAKSMNDIMARIAQSEEETVLIQYLEKKELISVSVRDFMNSVNQLSALLIANNLTKKNIGIIGRNSVEWLAAFCAVTTIGDTAVLMNADLRVKEIRDAVRNTDISAIFCDKEIAEQLRGDDGLLNLPFFSLEEKTWEDYPPYAVKYYEAQPEDIICIIFTSGTTGDQKAVMLSNRAMMLGMEGFVQTSYKESPTSGLAVTPFHHLLGLLAALSGLYIKDCILGIADGPMRLMRSIYDIKPETVFLVPSLLQALWQELMKKGRNAVFTKYIKHITCGGAQFPAELVKDFYACGISITNIYGATETGGAVIFNQSDCEVKAKIGKLLIGEAKIEKGELLLRGDMIMSGYYGDEEATRRVLEGGWYHSGDLAVIDDEGNYYLTGRKKNLIILSNGENISPEELEGYLLSFTDISEVVVLEYRDMLWGVIWPNYPEKCSYEEREKIKNRIRTFVCEFNEHMPTYKRIHDLQFRNTPLPKNASGKILRNQVEIEE